MIEPELFGRVKLFKFSIDQGDKVEKLKKIFDCLQEGSSIYFFGKTSPTSMQYNLVLMNPEWDVVPEGERPPETNL